MAVVSDARREEWLARTQIREQAKIERYLRLAERDGCVCNHCGGVEDLTIDHVVPGGGSDDENLQLLCRQCNSGKGTSTEDKTVRWTSSLFQAGFTMLPNLVLLDGSLSVHAHRVYSLLLHYARQDERCWPGQEGLATKAGCSERSVRAAIRELEVAELLHTRRRGQGKTNVYVLRTPRFRPASGADQSFEPASGADQERHEPPFPMEEDAGKKTQGPHETLSASWLERTPPLIAHRESYFADSKARRATDRALRVYPVEVVAEAISNYATVLGGTDYRWSHRWTFVDFLGRGLDKFVPEAEPLRNYRARHAPAGPSSEDFGQMPDFD